MQDTLVKNVKYALFVGRWQPFHNGHKAIIDTILNQGKNVLIGVRNTPIDEKNMFSVQERIKMIENVYHSEINEGKIKIIELPDIESINYSRDVGYSINEIHVSEEAKLISATKIRGSIVNSTDEWKSYVPSSNKKGFLLWFTGLSQSGKTTISNQVYEKLKSMNIRVEKLDGDILRNTVNKDLGYTKEDRIENIRRAGFIAKYLTNMGVNVVASFISPYKEQREELRKSIDNFIEVFCDCPTEVCESRDTKGLYEKARSGIIKNFTGISDPYEKPENAEIVLKTEKDDVNKCVETVMDYLTNIDKIR